MQESHTQGDTNKKDPWSKNTVLVHASPKRMLVFDYISNDISDTELEALREVDVLVESLIRL